ARGQLVGLHDQRKALTLERLLDVANIVEIRQRVAGAVPAGVERQGVLLKHPLEQPDGTGLILNDQPVTGGVTEDGAEAELLVKRAGTGQILDSKADGEISQSHVHDLCGKSGSSSATPVVGRFELFPGGAWHALRKSPPPYGGGLYLRACHTLTGHVRSWYMPNRGGLAKSCESPSERDQPRH